MHILLWHIGFGFFWLLHADTVSRLNKFHELLAGCFIPKVRPPFLSWNECPYPTTKSEEKQNKTSDYAMRLCMAKHGRLYQLVLLGLPPVWDKCLTTSTQSQPRGRSSMLPPNLSNILRFWCFDNCSFFSFLAPPPSSPPPLGAADDKLVWLLAWNSGKGIQSQHCANAVFIQENCLIDCWMPTTLFCSTRCNNLTQTSLSSPFSVKIKINSTTSSKSHAALDRAKPQRCWRIYMYISMKTYVSKNKWIHNFYTCAWTCVTWISVHAHTHYKYNKETKKKKKEVWLQHSDSFSRVSS